MAGIGTETTSDAGGGLDVCNVKNNTGDSYVAFDNVDFGSGAASVSARVASAVAGGRVEFRLGGPIGALIGAVMVGNTGGWQSWQTMTAPVSGASDIHPLFVVFRGAASNLNWFNFNGVLPPKNRFLRGDANADGVIDISDAIAVLGFLFLGSPRNDCSDAGDVNDDGVVDISDPTRLLGHMFLGSERPPDPFTACGVDPTEDELDCRTFDECP